MCRISGEIKSYNVVRGMFFRSNTFFWWRDAERRLADVEDFTRQLSERRQTRKEMFRGEEGVRAFRESINCPLRLLRPTSTARQLRIKNCAVRCAQDSSPRWILKLCIDEPVDSIRAQHNTVLRAACVLHFFRCSLRPKTDGSKVCAVG